MSDWREERGGEYYDRGPLSSALRELQDERAAVAQAQAQVAALEAELQAMRSRFLYAQACRVADSKLVRTVRGNRTVARLERRIRGSGRARSAA